MVLLISAVSSLYSQCTNEYRFRKPTVSGGVYKFTGVLPGIDAYVTQTGSNNATVDKIDDSTVYPYAWQPFVKFTSATTNASDSSYVEFEVEFKKGGTADTQLCLLSTIVNLDGGTNYKEFVKALMPVSAVGSVSSNIAWDIDSTWHLFKATRTSQGTIDTTDYPVMAQMRYKNTAKYKLRVGAIGVVSANQVNEYSFYFKKFDVLYIPLPIKPETEKPNVAQPKPERDIIFYDNYGMVIYQGTVKNFMENVAKPQTLYFTDRKVKYMKM